jgi:hypothetical protein
MLREKSHLSSDMQDVQGGLPSIKNDVSLSARSAYRLHLKGVSKAEEALLD